MSPFNRLAHGSHGREHGPRSVERGRAGGRQARGAAGSVEEWCAEVLFELADLCADTGLADVDARRGAGEIRLLGHGDEVLELPDFHN